VIKRENGYREKKPRLSTSRYYPDVETLGPGEVRCSELKDPLTQTQLLVQTPILDT
jgi:hypothetical protein